MEPELTYMDNLILSGALEVVGIKDDGQLTYRFTEKLESVDPNLKYNLEQEFYNSIMHLWSKGFLDVRSSDEGGKVMVTEKAFDSSAQEELGDYHKKILFIVMEAFRNQ